MMGASRGSRLLSRMFPTETGVITAVASVSVRPVGLSGSLRLDAVICRSSSPPEASADLVQIVAPRAGCTARLWRQRVGVVVERVVEQALTDGQVGDKR